ncbi:sodium:calcium antiporter [Halorussus caseinilyticus]|uniref:Sodium:calcium antiporter n=1 Tax=Halorussus caseinilyticus TaxID=3034025 RepID=A0ABD5WPQ0_9EURY|nr:sodium:calcium antiporter [Halorussus sp. DT72]
MVTPILEYAVVAVVATAVIWKASGLLERAAENLSVYYGLPAVVQGAVVVAVGSSFPELSSAVISTWIHGEFDLGVSAIVGSAIFNLLVIPALSGILGDGVEADRTLVYKEAQFYMISVSVLVITFALAVIYNPVEGMRLGGSVTRRLALIPVGFYAVYVFTQYQDTMDHDAEAAPGDVEPLKEWAFLAVSLVLIAGAVEGLVHAALGFGEVFDTPSFVWGLTVIAAGTSLPDTLVSVRAARDDEGVTSLANVLGSNVFDLLVAVPAGILVAGTAPIDFAVAVPMMGFLTLATMVVFGFLRTELALSTGESYALLAFYGVFIVWMVLETLDVTGLVPGA